MSILYPPYIEGKLPAQIGDVLRIPYQLNRALGEADLQGKYVHARVKTVSTGKTVSELKTAFKANGKDGVYTAEFGGAALTKEQYYKVQLAFGESAPSSAVYYSSVGVFKCIDEPTIQIKQSMDVWTGTFNHASEKVEYYKFDVYDTDNLIKTTGWCPNVDSSAAHTFIYAPEVPLSYVIYSVRTFGGYEGSSNQAFTKPLISPLEVTVLSDGKARGIVTMDAEDGFVSVGLECDADGRSLRGDFYIMRAKDGGSWERIQQIRLNTMLRKKITNVIFEDFTVEHGHTYEYGLAQYDLTNSLVTEPFKIGAVQALFDCDYLYDGERQLKIKFNPKVSSFKTTILESKLDTLGGQHPFFFRNGVVNYKDFPISGLVSLHSDENGRFLLRDNETLYREATPSQSSTKSGFTTNLTHDIFAEEREFKLEVLNWLNNGKPKLFRSAAEGNYIVRLMNINLAPEERLGRMLHTFNANAYEVANYNIESLQKYEIIKPITKKLGNLHYLIQTVSPGVRHKIINAIKMTISLTKNIGTPEIPVYPTQHIEVTHADGFVAKLRIGPSPQYEYFINKENPVVQIKNLDYRTGYNISVEYWYEENTNYPIAPSDIEADDIGKLAVIRIGGKHTFTAKRILYVRIFDNPNPGATGNDFSYSINGSDNKLSQSKDLGDNKYEPQFAHSVEFSEKQLPIRSVSIGASLQADIVYIYTGKEELKSNDV